MGIFLLPVTRSRGGFNISTWKEKGLVRGVVTFHLPDPCDQCTALHGASENRDTLFYSRQQWMSSRGRFLSWARDPTGNGLLWEERLKFPGLSPFEGLSGREEAGDTSCRARGLSPGLGRGCLSFFHSSPAPLHAAASPAPSAPSSEPGGSRRGSARRGRERWAQPRAALPASALRLNSLMSGKLKGGGLLWPAPRTAPWITAQPRGQRDLSPARAGSEPLVPGKFPRPPHGCSRVVRLRRVFPARGPGFSGTQTSGDVSRDRGGGGLWEAGNFFLKPASFVQFQLRAGEGRVQTGRGWGLGPSGWVQTISRSRGLAAQAGAGREGRGVPLGAAPTWQRRGHARALGLATRCFAAGRLGPFHFSFPPSHPHFRLMLS